MTMHEEWTDQLSDYLDGDLSAAEHAEVDAHLHGCSACSAVLNDLKRVVARAESAEARPPRNDLWTGITGRLDAERPTTVTPFPRRKARRIAFTMPQLAAAAGVLIAISAGLGAKLLAPSNEPMPPGAFVAQPPPSVAEVAADARVETVGFADAQYDAAVADLEQALKKGRGRLDASTIAIVEQNLQIIDRAIEQARDALAADPANSYLSSHFVETRRRKLDLLRRAAALTSDTD